MAAARVSIPEVARRIIEDIKEIAGGHADVEVYAVLRECDMDPNEATQRLLSRGTFHEVKRKRDKKKESRKESVDPRLRPGVQDRDVKGWQGNYSSHLSGRKPLVGKEIGVNQNMDKENSIFMKRNMEPKTSTFSQSLSGGLSNDPSQHVAPIEENYAAVGHFLSSDSKRSADLEDTKDVSTSVLDVNQSVQPSPSISRLHISAVEPIPTPSLEAHSNGDICSTEHDENQQTAGVQEEKMIPSWGRTPMSRIHLWNPESTSKLTQAENVMYEDVPIRVGTVTLSVPVLNLVRKEDLSLKVDKKLADDKQRVIIPDHLQVTESEKYGLTFGSFGTSFEQTTPKVPECDKRSTPPHEDSSQELHDVVPEPAISCQDASSGITMETVDGSSPQRVYGSSEIPEVAGTDLAKDSSAASHVPLDSVDQTTKHDDQTQVLETLESQVPQSSDFSESYHTQIYQPIDDDVEVHLSPFIAPGAPIKYGNIPASHAQTSETQELPQGIDSSSFVVPSPGLVLPVPTDSGILPSSIAIPQPPVPLFHQPVGVHLPHYAPSFIPYNHYISPFYYPPHSLNHFMGNAPVFLQSPSSAGMYPPVSASVAPPVKYSSSAYKTDDNAGSQTHVRIPGAYAVYGSSSSVYTNNAVVMNGTSVETDDVTGSQFKESNVFVARQQSDGSTLWIPAPGQDVSLLQPTSFSDLPSQGQHMAFAPAHAGHGAFQGMYRPAHTMAGPAFHPLQSSQTTAGAVETVGLPASGYQQPQHAQMNWAGY